MSWFYENIGYRFKYVYNSIKNLIRWFPIIWKDRDWDHAYVEDILLFKLNNMYKRFSDPNATYVNWETEHAKPALKALNICVKILERRRDNYYTDYWWDRGQTNEDLIISYQLEKRDWRLFCLMMEKYFNYWWD
jgi:hypothetical protein